MERHRRVVDDLPVLGPDLYDAPSLIGQIQIDSALMFRQPAINLSLWSLEMSFGLDLIERRLKRLRARGAGSRFEEAAGQPMPKLLASNLQGLAMSVDANLGICSLVGRVEQLGLRRQTDEDVGMTRLSPGSTAVQFRDLLVEAADEDSCLLQLGPKLLELGGLFLVQVRETGEYLGLKRRAGVGLCFFDQFFERIGDHFGLLDHFGDLLLGVSHLPPSGLTPISMALKSAPAGGRAIRTSRPSRLHRSAAVLAAVSPASSPSARMMTSWITGGRSSERRPDVDSAAQADRPVACIAESAVSMPSAIINRSPTGPSRTAPPRQGPSIFFGGVTGALAPPSRDKNVRWMPIGSPSVPRVISATMAGHMLSECFRAGWKRSESGLGILMPRARR